MYKPYSKKELQYALELIKTIPKKDRKALKNQIVEFFNAIDALSKTNKGTYVTERYAHDFDFFSYAIKLSVQGFIKCVELCVLYKTVPGELLHEQDVKLVTNISNDRIYYFIRSKNGVRYFETTVGHWNILLTP